MSLKRPLTQNPSVSFFRESTGPEFPRVEQTAAIGQVGLIPVAARSVRFYANGPLSVTFAGQEVPLFTLGTGPNYTIYGGDVTTFAGQTGELRFEANAISPSTWGSSLDNIFFSNQPAPEPGALGFAALAVLLLGWRSMRSRIVPRQ